MIMRKPACFSATKGPASAKASRSVTTATCRIAHRFQEPCHQELKEHACTYACMQHACMYVYVYVYFLNRVLNAALEQAAAVPNLLNLVCMLPSVHSSPSASHDANCRHWESKKWWEDSKAGKTDFCPHHGRRRGRSHYRGRSGND